MQYQYVWHKPGSRVFNLEFWCQRCTLLWCSVKNLTDRISAILINETKSNHFWNGSLRTMKNGSHTTIMYIVEARWSSANGGEARIDAKKSCVCNGIGKESFTTSCCLIKRLILTFTVNNWKDYAKQQIERKRPELIKRKGIVFHNARPHSLATHQKLKEPGWEVLMHPFYSPDLALSDYHLFRSLQNSLNGVKLILNEDPSSTY